MKSDSEIMRDVEAELRWSPDFDETDVAVKVNDSVVTMTGFVHEFAEKYQAETAVKRVAGVAGVANDIEVRLPSRDRVADPEIAREAVAALRHELPIACENIKVLLHQGRVTLEGAVEWGYQKEYAENAVRRLRDITGVSNLIVVRPRVAPTEVKRRIEEAFRRSAEVDGKSISVDAHGGEVTLKGKVRSWAERQEAQHTAWCAPGVTQVRNEITVSP